MNEPPSNFAELMERARHGDAAAITELCQKYEPKLRIVARVLLGPELRPHLDSVDLVQSVHRSLLLGLHDNKYDISNPERLLALAVTIVRRKAARHWRRIRRQQRLTKGEAELELLPRLLAELVDMEAGPARTIELRDEVSHICRSLSHQERQIFKLRAEGFSTAEIAARMELHPTTLRVRMTRLRERLRSTHFPCQWF